MHIVLGSNLSSSVRAHFRKRAGVAKASPLHILPASLGLFKSSEPFAEPFYREGKSLTDFEARRKEIEGQPVTILQSTAAPVSRNVLQLLLTVRTLKRYGVGEITVAMPFAAFARQDREFPGRFCSVAGDDFPFLLKQAGVDRIITQEVHSKAAEKFYTSHFGINNVSFLSSTSLFATDMRAQLTGDVVIGAPDGADKPGDAGQKRARDLTALFLKVVTLTPEQEKEHMFRIAKAHTSASSTKIMSFDGNVAGKTGVIVDDMTDSGGTVINAGRALKNNGAHTTIAYLSHALFKASALKKIMTQTMEDGRPVIDRLVLTDTVPGIDRKIARLEKDVPGMGARVQILHTGPLLEKRILSFVPG